MAHPTHHFLGIGEEKSLSTRKTAFLGQVGITVDGRRFRYAQNSSAASLAAGVAVQSAAQPASSVYADALVANLANGVSATVAVGVTTITFTTGSTAIAANYFQDGYLYVKVGPGAGAYLVKEHTSGSSANGITVTLYANDAIRHTAHTTATRYALQSNLYKDVIVNPAAGSQTGTVLGATHTTVAASQFFWLQTDGPAPLLMASAVAVPGQAVTAGATAGENDAATTADPMQLRPVLGYGIHIAATTQVIDLINMKIG